LHIEILSETNEQANFTVHDMQGKLIARNEAFLNNSDINLSAFPAGMYLLRVFVGANSKEWKVIKE